MRVELAYHLHLLSPVVSLRINARYVISFFIILLASVAFTSAQYMGWTQYLNPSKNQNLGFGVCLFGDSLAVVGSVNNKEFIALLDRSTGKVIKTWTGGGVWLTSCLSIGDRLYVVGYQSMYIFNKELNIVKSVYINWVPTDIAFDGTYIYVAGYTGKDVDGDGYTDVVWRIAKLNINLDLLAYNNFYIEGQKAVNMYEFRTNKIAINPATGDLWVVGWYASSPSDHSLVVVFDKWLGVKKVAYNRSDIISLVDICFDEEGYAYAVGSWGIVKLDKYGNVRAVTYNVAGSKVICAGGRVYVFGEKLIDGFRRHVLYVMDEELFTLTEIVLSRANVHSYFRHGSAAFDGKYLYVTGDYEDTITFESKIVVYSIPLPMPILVVNEENLSLSDVFVKVVVGSHTFITKTGPNGIAVFGGFVPERVYIYDKSGLLVGYAAGNKARVVVRYVGEVKVANSFNAKGYAVFRGEFLNGSSKTLTCPFTILNGLMRIENPLPAIYPIELYLTSISLGSQEVAVNKSVLVYKGEAGGLLKGLDFADGGLASLVSISAVNSTGSPKPNWTLQVLYKNITLTEGMGTVSVLLPRSSFLDSSYTVRVFTDAILPNGKTFVFEQTIDVTQRLHVIQVSVPTVNVVVQVVDGFGRPRDWPVAIENVKSGVGQIAATLVEGLSYVAKAVGLGFTNITVFTAERQRTTLTLKIPTAEISAKVVDGFGNVRNDWPIEIVGVVGGKGYVTTEVLAGRHMVRAIALGREFTRQVEVAPGQSYTVVVQVPTAKLTVEAVDSTGAAISSVDFVKLEGSISITSKELLRGVEVLAGTYTIRVAALGREVSITASLSPGEVKTLKVVLPLTQNRSETRTFYTTQIQKPTHTRESPIQQTVTQTSFPLQDTIDVRFIGILVGIAVVVILLTVSVSPRASQTAKLAEARF